MDSRLPPRIVLLTGCLVALLALAFWTPPAAAQGTTLTVTKTEDTDDGVCDQDCSLREAIADANDGGTIDIPAGTYTLTLGSLPEIRRDLTLVGDGAERVVIQGTIGTHVAGFPVFRTFADNFVMSGMTIRHAKGAIVNWGTLSLTDVVINDNVAAASGGGINNIGTLHLHDSIISDNLSNLSSGRGGGIYNTGTLTISDTAIIRNSSHSGGAIFNSGTLNLSNTTVRDNTARSVAGGIYNSTEILTISDSAIDNNSAELQGGGIWNHGNLKLTNSTVLGNTVRTDVASPSKGGGIYNLNASLTLNGSTVSGNAAKEGGGIHNNSNRIVTVRLSTISYNRADLGGGLYNSFGEVELTSSTISRNEANSGGGLYKERGEVELVSSTITANAATSVFGSGGGIFGTAKLANTIITGNTADAAPNCTGANSLGYNFFGDSACGLNATTTDLVGTVDNPVDPLLSPLQDNGGPTETHALLPGSPAIDHVPGEDCTDTDGNPIVADQRGQVRPFDGDVDGTSACDIGAFEFVPPCGDQNGDGLANILDRVIDLQITMGAIIPNDTQVNLNDLNLDDRINVFDAILGLQHIVGSRMSLECAIQGAGAE